MRKSLDPNSEFQRRRQRKIARWNRPLETRWDRLRAWVNMIFVDHGFFRYLYLNLHRVGERAWRSAQPAPHQIRAFARRGGRSVVSLRGGQFFGSLPLERETCAEEGLAFHNFVLRSRSLPDREELAAAQRLFESLEYPVLFHCKSGADRAGFMSALYLALAEGRPVAEAKAQLSLRFGHVRQGKTGVLDAFFDAYERETGGRVPLAEWIETGYDREAVIRGHRTARWASWLTDVVLRRE
ncbi:tyrosine-protein phosphatase [Paralimibaculum aggregatum]|uniref:Tyrosine-protein phosphatase n=1 Tax=Paralimibaculum aggregatum TaxID=3036245 RepID=A0ABQ6LI55_9RHOB|nr:tyrosine-protein phosphatase [Limibaculum sp. NKW23]GMG82969.1 tyrosine-protein phosphatase [Limibaculum sp. NKW23]